jgi:molecular chaperone GrpE
VKKNQDTKLDENPEENLNPETAQAQEAHSPDEAAGSEPSATPDLQAEVEKYRDAALRAAADLENFRKRMIREKEEAIRFANAGLLEKLLPILDNFQLGLDAAAADKAAQGIVSGFSMVHRQLGDFLITCGLQPIDAAGQPFDPKFHEALGHESEPGQADGIVLRQTRRGYKLADRLIRPSSVIVNKLS